MADTTQVPLPTHPDGVPWPTAQWPRAELDPKVNADLLNKTLDWGLTEPQPDQLERTHATLVVHHGAIVAERYAHDAKAEDTFSSWSMAKSITNACIGILARKGDIDIHAPADVPEWQTDPQDPRRAITWDQLLRMVDGLYWREEYFDADNSEILPMLYGSGKDDMGAFAAALKPDKPPEERWQYNSGASNLLARKVGHVVGGGEEGMRAFMKRELFDVLGMGSADPKFDAAGTFIGSSYCFATAQDFARFGTLYLRDGVWDGTRVLPEGWVDYTRTPTPQSEQLTYGAHFWMYPGSLGMFYCSGFAGQRTIIVPKLDLVVVRLGNTSVDKTEHVNEYTKRVVDAFRPTVA